MLLLLVINGEALHPSRDTSYMVGHLPTESWPVHPGTQGTPGDPWLTVPSSLTTLWLPEVVHVAVLEGCCKIDPPGASAS